ncbi:hypothetical protein H4Q26_000769 [Puccinia striiformis f. sp. tritici PST-130]|nr:hypothetical protein H4Q26_000769 [Puccinia striiformis f. sp. tritici PST-130]
MRSDALSAYELSALCTRSRHRLCHSESNINDRPPLPDSIQMLIKLEERICRDLATLEQLNDHETAQKLNLRLQCIELLYFNAQMLNCDRPPQAVPPPTIEDICILRHREITTKAVLAILISTLKWFKASQVMKFHYLAQLLVDLNCLLLMSRMFGLQEVAVQIQTQNKCEDYNLVLVKLEAESEKVGRAKRNFSSSSLPLS